MTNNLRNLANEVLNMEDCPYCSQAKELAEEVLDYLDSEYDNAVRESYL